MHDNTKIAISGLGFLAILAVIWLVIRKVTK